MEADKFSSIIILVIFLTTPLPSRLLFFQDTDDAAQTLKAPVKSGISMYDAKGKRTKIVLCCALVDI